MINLEFKWKQWWMILAVMSVSYGCKQPSHIVFIMVDDMGWNDVSYHGSNQILTPNIDALAYQGVILQQYYSEAICTPARTALLTGKYPMRLGMHGMPLFNSEDRGIPLTERLLPSYLKELGYSTNLVGKWHVGMSRREFLPTSRGYDTHYGMRGGFVDYYTYNKVESWPSGRLLYGLDLYDGQIPQTKEERYIVDALTDRAVKIIQRHNASMPLFLHVTHNAPHAGNNGAPLQPALNSRLKNKHIANSDRRLYAEVVSKVDRSVGEIFRTLVENNMWEDTLIIFASDNGAPTVGDLSNWGINLPLRGKKYSPWEGAVRVPAFIWHSSFQPRVWNGLMHITDWLPTLLAAAGGRLDKNIDGINQWDSIVQGQDSKRKEVLLTVEDSTNNVYAAFRAGDYKVVVGNVTGISNGYYGEDLLANKWPPPDYLLTLKSGLVSRVFEEMDIYLEDDTVETLRSAATIRQEDKVRDATPCIPTMDRGCLFNVRRDPTESHDLWNQAPSMVSLLTSRLNALFSMQLRRGPLNIQNAADPALYGYIWKPWITEFSNNVIPIQRNKGVFNFNLSYSMNRTGDVMTTQAQAINCNGTYGFRNFLCLLRSVF